MTRISGVLLAALLVGCAPSEPPLPTAALVEPAGVTMGTWRKVDAATSRLIDLAALEELAGQFPDSGAVQVRYFNALLRGGDAPTAYALLDRIQARGYRFSESAEAQINQFFAANGYPKPISLALRPEDVREASTLAATVPENVHIVEAALREQKSGRIFVTAIASRGPFREDGKGGWERIPLSVSGSHAGIVQDPEGALWFTSAAYEPTAEPEAAFRGLVGYDPVGGASWRIPAPADATPSDIALGMGDTLFAADPLNGAIYRGQKGDGSLREFIAPGTFRSAQGMAASADGRFLYVSDYGYGLALIDLRTGAIDRLPAPNSPFVEGTDGLWLHNGELIAIQNGTRPARIVAHRLAPDGRSIVDTRVLESAHPAWIELGSGSIDGDSLLYVATGQWDRFGKGGATVEGKPPLPTELRVLPLAEKPAPPPKKRR
ncbi:hypothetical protein ACWPM1_08715 [Tsuneonella sp. HG249]